MAAPVEKFVTTVRELSQQANTTTIDHYNVRIPGGAFVNLCEFISKSLDGLMKSPCLHLDNALETLDYQQHSLGVLALLLAKYSQDDYGDFSVLFTQTEKMVRHGNGEQLRRAAETFMEVLHRFTEILIKMSQANRGILILVQAIEKARLSPSQLTSIHSNLCHLCLVAKNFSPVLPFLEVEITDIAKENGHFEVKHFLLYYYYGGMIYTAMKKYERAAFFFETAVTTPACVVSHIMTEAYKKLLLVSLIYIGREPSMSKYASPIVGRYIKQLALPYHKLADAFKTSSSEQLKSVSEEHRAIFEQDSNVGLVKQCIQSLYKKNINTLTKTFLTLSLSDVANRVKLSNAQEAEKCILHMIQDGDIFATINQKDGMVQFLDNPERFDNPAMLDVLHKQESLCMTLNKKLAEMDRDISVNADYVRKTSAHGEEDPGSSAKSTSYNL